MTHQKIVSFFFQIYLFGSATTRQNMKKKIKLTFGVQEIYKSS